MLDLVYIKQNTTVNTTFTFSSIQLEALDNEYNHTLLQEGK